MFVLRLLLIVVRSDCEGFRRSEWEEKRDYDENDDDDILLKSGHL